ncbi:hypothetical protein P3X46_010627, partial [Hevea brasiliensis]
MDSRDQNKFCRFHDGFGHNINDCIQLKEEIERLVRNGTLRRFTSHTQSYHDEDYRERSEHRL